MKPNLHRKRKRGAVLVEAVTVISFFIVCFLGIIYFKDLYTAKLHAQRLARASAIAHAMGACRGSATAGIEDDLPSKSRNQKLDERSAADQTPIDTKGNDTAKEALKDLERSKDGAPMVEITAIRVSTSATSTTKKDRTSKGLEFRSDDIASESYVVCNDPVSRDQYTEIIPRIQEIFEKFL